jgi:hypothetical protein
MEAVFAALPRLSAPAQEEIAARTEPRGSRGRAWIWIMLLVAAVLIAAAVSLVFLAHTSHAPLPRTRPRAALVPPAPRLSAQAPAAAPPAQPLPALPSIAPAVAAPAPRNAAPRPKIESHKPLHRTVAPQPQQAAAPQSRHRAATPEPHSRCNAGATSAWCLQDAVAAADGRLRDAYTAAIRAGVDRKTLAGVRSDWSRLRRHANKEPVALIRGYGLLTQELRAEADRAGRR